MWPVLFELNSLVGVVLLSMGVLRNVSGVLVDSSLELHSVVFGASKLVSLYYGALHLRFIYFGQVSKSVLSLVKTKSIRRLVISHSCEVVL